MEQPPYNLQPPSAGFGHSMGQGPRPDNYLVKSILVTFFCCLPLGIVAIVNSANVNSRYDMGDYNGALRASADANKWANYGIIAGLVGAALYVAVMLIFGISMFGLMGGMGR